MNNLNIIPLNKEHSGCELITAEIKAVTDGAIVIATDHGVINAKKAFSCLVALKVNDIVLVNYMPSGSHILSILERPDSSALDLKFPGDVKLSAASGKLDIVASDDINLISTADTNLLSKALTVTTPKINMHVKKLDAVVTDINAVSSNVRLNTKFLDVVAQQISQRTEVLVRWVENIETLNIGSLIQNIRNNLTSHSQQAVITASKDMRIDAERIHMG